MAVQMVTVIFLINRGVCMAYMARYNEASLKCIQLPNMSQPAPTINTAPQLLSIQQFPPFFPFCSASGLCIFGKCVTRSQGASCGMEKIPCFQLLVVVVFFEMISTMRLIMSKGATTVPPSPQKNIRSIWTSNKHQLLQGSSAILFTLKKNAR